MSEPTIADEPQYLTFLEDVRSRIQHTQIRVVKSANRELIGADLRIDAEGLRGFLAQNLCYMRQFYIVIEQSKSMRLSA